MEKEKFDFNDWFYDNREGIGLVLILIPVLVIWIGSFFLSVFLGVVITMFVMIITGTAMLG